MIGEQNELFLRTVACPVPQIFFESVDASIRIAPRLPVALIRTYISFRTRFEKRPSFDFLSVLTHG
jgi:hypothetical protein